ncbi:uncharacterized protein LOC123500953 [Portunus trituberculatus]|uniref:uncharacterized protein LOC123500953 n=1 Tax=Portunus trituberculatus TaxID=210409 RepID=UPI001E1D1CFE|nr:uncharacterized protein LOC123500953 [Portunus trituberculatus]
MRQITAWGSAWQVRFAPQKTKLLVASRSRPALQLDFSGETLTPQDEVEVLGVTYDRELTFRTHIERLAREASGRISWLLDSEGLELLYKTQVRSSLEYACLAWGGAARTHLALLDKVQERAARLIKGNNTGQEPCLHTLQHRRDVAGITVMYKVHVCHVSHLEALRQPSRLAEVHTRAVTLAPKELLQPRCRTWHHQRQFHGSLAHSTAGGDRHHTPTPGLRVPLHQATLLATAPFLPLPLHCHQRFREYIAPCSPPPSWSLYITYLHWRHDTTTSFEPDRRLQSTCTVSSRLNYRSVVRLSPAACTEVCVVRFSPVACTEVRVERLSPAACFEVRVERLSPAACNEVRVERLSPAACTEVRVERLSPAAFTEVCVVRLSPAAFTEVCVVRLSSAACTEVCVERLSRAAFTEVCVVRLSRDAFTEVCVVRLSPAAFTEVFVVRLSPAAFMKVCVVRLSPAACTEECVVRLSLYVPRCLCVRCAFLLPATPTVIPKRRFEHCIDIVLTCAR